MKDLLLGQFLLEKQFFQQHNWFELLFPQVSLWLTANHIQPQLRTVYHADSDLTLAEVRVQIPDALVTYYYLRWGGGSK